MKNLKSKNLNYTIVREFLLNLKKEFIREDNKTIKMAKLKKIEQERKTMKEFV